jgi:hypothetical protein
MPLNPETHCAQCHEPLSLYSHCWQCEYPPMDPKQQAAPYCDGKCGVCLCQSITKTTTVTAAATQSK